MPKLTDLEAVQMFLDGVDEIRTSEARSGFIHVWISDGTIRYVNAEKPPVSRRQKCNQQDIIKLERESDDDNQSES